MNFAWALPIIGAALSFAGGWQEHISAVTYGRKVRTWRRTKTFAS